MPGGPGGQPPGPPMGGMGAASSPMPMAGHQNAAMQKLMVALKALQDCLSGIPIGSELHNEVISAIQKIGKHLPQGGAGGDPMAQVQELAALARGARQQPGQMQHLQGMMGGGAPPPPAAPPPAA